MAVIRRRQTTTTAEVSQLVHGAWLTALAVCSVVISLSVIVVGAATLLLHLRGRRCVDLLFKVRRAVPPPPTCATDPESSSTFLTQSPTHPQTEQEPCTAGLFSPSPVGRLPVVDITQVTVV